MKCKCGNGQGMPLVNPRPIKDSKGNPLLYTGGMSAGGQCWFCAFPHQVPVLTEEQTEYVRMALGG